MFYVTGYGLDDRVSISGGGWEFFSSTPRSDRLWGPPKLPANGYWRSFSPGVKRPGCESDRSPPSSAEVKERVELNVYSATHLHGVVLS